MVNGEVSCYGKKKFTYWQAQKACRNLNKHRDGAKANVYRCPTCRAFHVGNTLNEKKFEKRINRHNAKKELRNGRI